MKNILLKSTYDYFLPEELIAQSPIEPRDSSRLLVCSTKNQKIEHKIFRDITEYLNSGDVLVINSTKVLPARIFAKKDKTGANIEVLLQKRINLTDWEVLVKPGKRCKIGTKLQFCDEMSGEIIEETDFGGRIIRFIFEGVFEVILNKIGQMPLPTYIHQKIDDPNRYQTVYAKTEGASAAPTAGLHFTTNLLNELKAKGVVVVEVLLHVGLGTFRPVKEENILLHNMHSEYYEITQSACDTINSARKNGNKIFAVGTTSVRVLESASNSNGIVEPKFENTNIFIYPGYKFKVVDCLITNFHLPKSTLIMLVSAMLGIEKTLNIYNIAVDNKYRFFSFGDAMLIYNE